MSYGKPIISTFDIENEPSRKYLEQYPLALLLAGKDQPQVNAEKVLAFITEFCGKSIEYEDLEKQFFLNTPAVFTQYIFENK